MKDIWGTDESSKIEFISYVPKYREQVLNVIRTSLFQRETVSVGSEINTNIEAQRELELLCEDILEKSSVSIIARDIVGDQIVGTALNAIQVKDPSCGGAPSYFETFRDEHCKTVQARSLMNYMIVADSRCDIFEKFQVDTTLEITFLAVLPEFGRKGVGYNLCKYSVELATALKNREDHGKSLANRQPRPELVTALWTGRNSQSIGAKLDFEVVYQEPFSNFSFDGKTFAEKVGDLSLTSQLVIKRI